MLEVGCGRGELARALQGAEHEVVAIDPEAPQGPIFRRVRLEEFADPGPFGAVVASLSLHHVDDLAGSIEKIASLVAPAGLVILREFARERLNETTARWYYHQRQARAAVGDAEPLSEPFERWTAEWAARHADIHPFESIKAELDRSFVQRYFEWTPYLFDYDLDESLEPLERKLIQSGAIQPTGVVYVGACVS